MYPESALLEFLIYLIKRSQAKRIICIGDNVANYLVNKKFNIEIIEYSFTKINSETNRLNNPSNYEKFRFIETDLEQPFLIDEKQLKHAIVVCFDILDELENPEPLIKTLSAAREHCKFLLITASDRFRTKGFSLNEASETSLSYPRWSAEEFFKTLVAAGFPQSMPFGFASDSSDREKKNTILTIAGIEAEPKAISGDFRVAAIINVFNEIDIIKPVVNHLAGQGIEVHIVDNWSDDGSFELCQRLLKKNLIKNLLRFPDIKNNDYEWAKQLEHTAEYAAQLDADWVIHHDADEIRCSPWQSFNLFQAIKFVDSQGYNAIDFTVIDFRFTNDYELNFSPDEFDFFEFGRHPSYHEQIKAWKNYHKAVDLVTSGGHDAQFKRQKVYPLKFLTKHYSLRGKKQATQKIFQYRIPRTLKERSELGWHVHYDQYKFLQSHEPWRPYELTFYDQIAFPYEFILERLSGIGVYQENPLSLNKNNALALRRTAEDMDERICQLSRTVKEKEEKVIESARRIEGLDQSLVERDGQIANLNLAMIEAARQIEDLNQSFAERDELDAGLNLAMIESARQIYNLNQTLAERNEEIASLNLFLADRDEQIARIKRSRSWRITKPFRFAARLARYGLFEEDRRWFEYRLRNVYRKLPVSKRCKSSLRDLYVRLFGRPHTDFSSASHHPLLAKPTHAGKQKGTGSNSRFISFSDVESKTSSPFVMPKNEIREFLAPELWPHRHTPYSVLILPVIDWHFRFQRPQQIARIFAQKGHPVTYASLSFGPELAVAHIEEGIQELQLPASKSLNVYVEMPSQADTGCIVEALLRFVLTTAPHRPWVCIAQLPFWEPIVSELAKRIAMPIVYDCMDDHAGFSTNGEIMLAAEDRLLHQADLVVASSDLLFAKIQEVSKQSLVVRNAVDYAHFAAVPGTQHTTSSTLIVGYYGAIADWFDSDLVAEMARLRPSWHFILIGSTFSANTKPLAGFSNIDLPGEKPYAKLPKLIAHWDCCIIPFKRLPLTEATNPVKVYEMLAAGKPVVAVSLPELLPIAELGLISLADTAAEFVREIESQISQDSLLRQKARRNYASKNTWEDRQDTLDQAIRQLYPLASVVVVTYNNLALNRLCLESLCNDTDYPNYEIIVVDNASSDGTAAYLESLKHPRLTVILNDQNLGFSAANNQGLARASGDFLCLLNNDTVVTGSWLTTLVRHLQSNPDFGLVGPVTNAVGNEAKIPVGYRNLLDMPAWADSYCRNRNGCLDEISMLAFFCVAMPRAVFEKVGLLDERFGLGMFEDDDYNRRVRDAGYKVKLARDVYIHHWQRASFKLLGEDAYLETYYENEKKYRSKWAVDAQKNTRADELAGLIAASKASPKTIIFAPSIGWNVHLFQRPHHLARVLAEDGYTVIFDCSNSHDDFALLKEVEPRLFLFKGEPELLADLHEPVLWTFTYNYEYRDRFPAGTPVIYDWIDDLSVFPYDQTVLAQLHARAMKEATVVASVARKLHESAQMDRSDAIYLPNAVEEGRFDHPPTPNPALADRAFKRIVSKRKPIAGYYGALAHWFDYELLARTAALRPDWQFVLIGPNHDGSMDKSDIRNHRNITWLGPRDYQALPGYLHLFDVAMIPFRINDITLATSPLKLFEYFAAGRPVVSTPMPECAAFKEVHIVGDADAFAGTLDEARNSIKNSGFLSRLTTLAQENTWRARAKLTMGVLRDKHK